MTQDQPVIRIGELLVQAGVITTYDLSEAEKLSSHMKVQFGRLLIMAGCLTEEALECALEAQGLIKEGILTAQIACEALAFAVQENIPLRQALEALDCLPQFGTSTLRLAELIHDANIIEEERLHDAFDTSMETNRPLPEVLVEMECISPGLLSIMLRMQEQIRNNTLDHEDSINELRGTFKIWKRADKAMANDPMSKSAIISATSLTPEKPSRFTSSFDTVNRLPAISNEMLASLNKESRVPDSSTVSAQAAAPENTSAAPTAPSAAPSAPPAHGAPPPQNFQNAPAAFSNQNAPNATNSAGAVNIPRPPNYPSTPSANMHGAPSQHPSPSAPASHSGLSANIRPSSQSASSRGGRDDLNVDWILNAPAGQPMPDEVILYSQGYFPPDPQKASNKEAFNDGFSDEDEQRINDLLDVFASDSPAAAPTVAGAPDRGQMGASKQGEPSREANFAQASYSASLAAAAADGWGVPDLAAAGANLSGAEMFARAQAELASGGWAYGQGSGSQTAHKFPTTSSNAPTDSSKVSSASDLANSPSSYSAQRTPPVVSPAPGPLGQPTFVTPVPPPAAPAQSALPAPPRPEANMGFMPSAPSIAEMPVNPIPPSPSPWAPPLPVAPSSAISPTTSPAASISAASSARQVPGEVAVDSSTQSLFSPTLADSISDALPVNPFKISKVGEIDSSKNITAIGAESKTDNSEVVGPIEAKVADQGDDQKSKVAQAEDDFSAVLETNSNHDRAVDAEVARNASGGVEAEQGSSEKGRVASEAAQHEFDSNSAKIAELPAKKEPDPPSSDASKTLELTEKDAHSKSETESKTENPSEPVVSAPVEPRGKFGTKHGLAAKRKANEGSQENVDRNDVVFLLKSANFFSADELEDAIVNSLRDQNKAIEILGILGIVDKSNLDAAVRLQKLVKAGSVEVDKAIESLTDLKSGKLRASELTEQLGIKKSKRRK